MRELPWPRKFLLKTSLLLHGAAPRDYDAWSYVATFFAGVLIFSIGAILYVAVNAAFLPFGQYAEPLWQTNATVRRLYFARGVPVIAVTAPLMIAFNTLWAWAERGALVALRPYIFTIGLALLMLAGVMLLGKLRGAAASRFGERT